MITDVKFVLSYFPVDSIYNKAVDRGWDMSKDYKDYVCLDECIVREKFDRFSTAWSEAKHIVTNTEFNTVVIAKETVLQDGNEFLIKTSDYGWIVTPKGMVRTRFTI